MTRRLSPNIFSSIAVVVGCCGALLAVPAAQRQERIPTARLVPAPLLVMPGEIDSNVPIAWDLVNGSWRLFAFASWGGIPERLAGESLDTMQRLGPVTIAGHPGHGVWIESVIPDDSGTWYGFYHHEAPADVCGKPDREIPRIGAVRSTDQGTTWQDLGIILEAPAHTHACDSRNAYVVGGVGDVTAVLDPARRDLFLYFTQYHRDRSAQGVAVARLAWADRDSPRGRATVWQNGVWLPPRRVVSSDGALEQWEFPAGTPLVRASRPWHDGDARADVLWGPSIHWNTYLEQYVMLLNRTRDERFTNEGIYVSFARNLDDPRGWSLPRKIVNGGNWYPQVAGLEPRVGSDKVAGQRARFFVTGRSEHYIDFQR